MQEPQNETRKVETRDPEIQRKESELIARAIRDGGSVVSTWRLKHNFGGMRGKKGFGTSIEQKTDGNASSKLLELVDRPRQRVAGWGGVVDAGEFGVLSDVLGADAKKADEYRKYMARTKIREALIADAIMTDDVRSYKHLSGFVDGASADQAVMRITYLALERSALDEVTASQDYVCGPDARPGNYLAFELHLPWEVGSSVYQATREDPTFIRRLVAEYIARKYDDDFQKDHTPPPYEKWDSYDNPQMIVGGRTVLSNGTILKGADGRELQAFEAIPIKKDPVAKE